MQHNRPSSIGAVAMLLVLGAIPLLSGCTSTPAEAAKIDAVTVLKVGDVNQLTLSPKASERLGMKTTPVVAGTARGQLAVPHAALLYDPDGKTFVYTSPKELVFMRADVTVLRITGATVVLTAGPAAGTPVVTIGAAELFGVDTGVGGGH